MKNYFDALKRRKAETGESGFSLIELIVVVVILGILAAIAVPVFTGLQAQADESAVKTIAANGASQVATELAKPVPSGGTAPTAASLQTAVDADLGTTDVDITVTVPSGTLGVDNFCVTATKTGITPAKSGPGC